MGTWHKLLELWFEHCREGVCSQTLISDYWLQIHWGWLWLGNEDERRVCKQICNYLCKYVCTLTISLIAEVHRVGGKYLQMMEVWTLQKLTNLCWIGRNCEHLMRHNWNLNSAVEFKLTFPGSLLINWVILTVSNMVYFAVINVWVTHQCHYYVTQL